MFDKHIRDGVVDYDGIRADIDKVASAVAKAFGSDRGTKAAISVMSDLTATKRSLDGVASDDMMALVQTAIDALASVVTAVIREDVDESVDTGFVMDAVEFLMFMFVTDEEFGEDTRRRVDETIAKFL